MGDYDADVGSTTVAGSFSALKCSGEVKSVDEDALPPRILTIVPGTPSAGLVGSATDSSIDEVSELERLKLGSRKMGGGFDDVVDETLARELKKPPTFDAKGVEEVDAVDW